MVSGHNITNRFSAIVNFVRVVLQKYTIAEIPLGRSGLDEKWSIQTIRAMVYTTQRKSQI